MITGRSSAPSSPPASGEKVAAAPTQCSNVIVEVGPTTQSFRKSFSTTNSAAARLLQWAKSQPLGQSRGELTALYSPMRSPDAMLRSDDPAIQAIRHEYQNRFGNHIQQEIEQLKSQVDDLSSKQNQLQQTLRASFPKRNPEIIQPRDSFLDSLIDSDDESLNEDLPSPTEQKICLEEADNHQSKTAAVLQVNPSEIVFKNFVPSQIYRGRFQLVNSGERRVRWQIHGASPILSTDEANPFALEGCKGANIGGILAPGMTTKLYVLFRPSSRKLVSSTLQIRASMLDKNGSFGSETLLSVSARGECDAPKLTIPHQVELPRCSAGTTTAQRLVIRNEGGAGAFELQLAGQSLDEKKSYEHAFQIHPKKFELDAGESITLMVQFQAMENMLPWVSCETSEPGAPILAYAKDVFPFTCNCIWLCDNGGEHPWTLSATISRARVHIMPNHVHIKTHPKLRTSQKITLRNLYARVIEFAWKHPVLEHVHCRMSPSQNVLQPKEEIELSLEFQCDQSGQWEVPFEFFVEGKPQFSYPVQVCCTPSQFSLFPKVIQVPGELLLDRPYSVHFQLKNSSMVSTRIHWKLIPSRYSGGCVASISVQGPPKIGSGMSAEYAIALTSHWIGRFSGQMRCICTTDVPTFQPNKPGENECNKTADDDDAEEEEEDELDDRTLWSCTLPIQFITSSAKYLIQIEPRKLEIGPIAWGSAVETSVQVINYGPRPYDWKLGSLKLDEYDITATPNFGHLLPGEQREIRLFIVPTKPGTHVGNLICATETTLGSLVPARPPGPTDSNFWTFMSSYLLPDGNSETLEMNQSQAMILRSEIQVQISVVCELSALQIPKALTVPGTWWVGVPVTLNLQLDNSLCSVTSSFRISSVDQDHFASQDPAQNEHVECLISARRGWVPAGHIADVTITLNAHREGDWNGQLILECPGTVSRTIELHGSPQSPTPLLAFNGLKVDFGIISLLERRQQEFVITNPCAHDLLVQITFVHDPELGPPLKPCPSVKIRNNLTESYSEACASKKLILDIGERLGMLFSTPELEFKLCSKEKKLIPISCGSNVPGVFGAQLLIRSGPCPTGPIDATTFAEIPLRAQVQGCPIQLSSPQISAYTPSNPLLEQQGLPRIGLSSVKMARLRPGRTFPIHLQNLAPYPCTLRFAIHDWTAPTPARGTLDEHSKIQLDRTTLIIPPQAARVVTAMVPLDLNHNIFGAFLMDVGIAECNVPISDSTSKLLLPSSSKTSELSKDEVDLCRIFGPYPPEADVQKSCLDRRRSVLEWATNHPYQAIYLSCETTNTFDRT
jgi:hypothetical protein